MNRMAGHIISLLLLMVIGFGCEPASPSDPPLRELRIGVLPDESRDILQKKFAPLLEYLEAETGLPCRLVISGSYETMLADFQANRMDLAYFGAVTYLMARESVGAGPIVMRNRDRQFTSYFIVRHDHPARSVPDLRGRSFAFGSRLSTSGHLMPRHFLNEWGHGPESFFGSIRHTSAHDDTVMAVREGQVDAGAVNAIIFEKMIEEGRLAPGELRILQQTPAYVDYLWAAQTTLSNARRNELREAFLKLSPDQENHQDVLHRLNAEYFMPAGDYEFGELLSIMKRTGMLETRQ